MRNKIEEIPNIKSALKHISYDTWVFFDLDNTVMESMLDLGGDQWFSHLMKYVPKPNHQHVLTLYYVLQAHVRTQPAEPKIGLIIKALQSIGIPVFALTARGPTILQETIQQLHDIGIDFSNNRMSASHAAPYNTGIICCNGLNKGHALGHFLSHCYQKPRHIIMLDDKNYHLDHIKTVVEPLQIDFSGFRYGFLDMKATQFDMNKANHQLAPLKDRLPLEAQEAIDALQLIPESIETGMHISQCSHGFFQQQEIKSSHSVPAQVSQFSHG